MKLRAAFLLVLLLLAQAVQPAAWLYAAPLQASPVSCLQEREEQQPETCCRTACSCCPEKAPAPAESCLCEVSPANDSAPPARPVAPPPPPSREASPVLTEWHSPEPPRASPLNHVTEKCSRFPAEIMLPAADKVRCCVRHCALLI